MDDMPGYIRGLVLTGVRHLLPPPDANDGGVEGHAEPIMSCVLVTGMSAKTQRYRRLATASMYSKQVSSPARRLHFHPYLAMFVWGKAAPLQRITSLIREAHLGPQTLVRFLLSVVASPRSLAYNPCRGDWRWPITRVGFPR